MGVMEALLVGSAFWIPGVGYACFPQTMFRIRHTPFPPSGDGLTDEGERSYRKLGFTMLISGVLVALYGLSL